MISPRFTLIMLNRSDLIASIFLPKFYGMTSWGWDKTKF